MQVPLFDNTRQFQALRESLLSSVESVLVSGKYILGPDVEIFEREAAEYLGVKHAIGVANGTDALWLALKAVGIGPNDRVLTTPFTFFATASAILTTGARPAMADIDPGSFNLSAKQVRMALEGKSEVNQRLGIRPDSIKAIIPVHLYGQSADMDELMDLAKEYHLAVIEDVAQAFGAEYKGQKLGGFGTSVASVSSPRRLWEVSATAASWSRTTTSSLPRYGCYDPIAPSRSITTISPAITAGSTRLERRCCPSS